MKAVFKKIKASEEDKHLIRSLRTMLSLNDYQYTMRMITEEEYKSNIEYIIDRLIMLEEKYGL